MKHYNFWKRGTIGFGGKIEAMTKQISLSFIFLQKLSIDCIEKILTASKISHKQISTLGSEGYMKFKKKIGTRVLTMNDNLCMNNFFWTHVFGF